MADLEPRQNANQIINRAATLCSLAPIVDAYATPDPNFILLRELLNISGQSLAREYDWTVLQREHSFTTTGAAAYDPPSDFAHLIDQTGWQQASMADAKPLAGPATPQTWSTLVAEAATQPALEVWFRQRNGKIMLMPATTTGIPVRYEYISRGWVLAGDATDTLRDHALGPSDVVLYEPLLIVQRLRLEFLQARGFDTEKAQDDYLLIYSSITGQDAGAPVLRLDRGSACGNLISARNVPDTGYG